MNIIAADDEKHALHSISEVIRNALPDCVLECFNRPDTALEYAAAGNRVDVAFLDIEMGGMNGLELAKRLKDVNGKTNIVFVTGYSEYALDAYSVAPSGYLLKPVAEADILRAIEELRHPLPPHTDARLRVQCFGNFDVFADGSPIRFPRSKSKELFAYLVHKCGTACTVKEIAAVLFEDKADGARQLQTYISAMMTALKGHEDVIIKNWGTLAVDAAKLNCDYYRFHEGDIEAVNTYSGEYMAAYSWAEFTVAYLDSKVFK
jgi:two-component SAPR family response regulator